MRDKNSNLQQRGRPPPDRFLTFTQSFVNTHLIALTADFGDHTASTFVLISKRPLVWGLILLDVKLAFKGLVHAVEALSIP